MRVFLIIIMCAFCKTFYGQTDSSVHYFKQIGWTIKVLPDFKPLDSATSAKAIAKGKAMVEGTMKREVNMSHLTNLINVSKEKFNNLDANLTLSPSINEKNWQTVDDSSKTIFYKTFVNQMPNAKIDSLSSTKTIDGIRFKAFNVDIAISNDIAIHTCFMTTFHNEMYFAITYVYINDNYGKEILRMIDESKFDK